MTEVENKETGTTNVVLTYEDGVVLGAEERVSLGNLVHSDTQRKVYQIDDRIGMTVAGTVGDVQSIVRFLRSETRLYDLRKAENISVKATATLLANILQGSKYFPYRGMFTLGGVDSDGPAVFSLDPLGGITDQEGYLAAGSGMPYALGVLEDQYEEDLEEDEAIPLVLRAVRAATQRDTASGGEGYTIAVINEDGYRELSDEEIESYLDSE